MKETPELEPDFNIEGFLGHPINNEAFNNLEFGLKSARLTLPKGNEISGYLLSEDGVFEFTKINNPSGEIEYLVNIHSEEN